MGHMSKSMLFERINIGIVIEKGTCPLMCWVFVTQTLNSFIVLLGGKVLLMMDKFSVMH
ncbi:hypothetical protein LINPERHAP2_LOCUS41245 [Linum perenne]